MGAKSKSWVWSKALIGLSGLISISSCSPSEANLSDFDRRCAVAAMRYVVPIPGASVTAIKSKPHDKKAMAESLVGNLKSVDEALELAVAFLFWDEVVDRQIRTTPREYWKNFLSEKVEKAIKQSVEMSIDVTSGVLRTPYASLCASPGTDRVFTVNWGLQ